MPWLTGSTFSGAALPFGGSLSCPFFSMVLIFRIAGLDVYSSTRWHAFSRRFKPYRSPSLGKTCTGFVSLLRLTSSGKKMFNYSSSAFASSMSPAQEFVSIIRKIFPVFHRHMLWLDNRITLLPGYPFMRSNP